MSRRNQGGSQANSNSTVLFVGLVPFDWDENNVRSVVCGSGKIVDVRMGFDYEGKNKGFVFVEYQTHEEALHGLRLLNQVMVNGPKPKKLRVELSKENLRANAPSSSKPLLQLSRSHLPNNVQLPPEMLNAVPAPSFYNQLPVQPGMNQQNNMHPQMNQQNFMNNVPQQPGGQIQPGSSTPTGGARNLPQPAALPFKTPDKISENLSHIPPAQLIELIANLKTVLSGPNATRAPEVFQLSPFLASSAAQALLLMGFINTEVINEAVAAPKYESTPQPTNVDINNYQQQHLPQYNNNNNNYQNSYQGNGLPSNPATAPQISKWPYLPIPTQQKLAAMPPEQADLIAQVLTIPPEQIPTLEPEKQVMVSNLRAQYL